MGGDGACTSIPSILQSKGSEGTITSKGKRGNHSRLVKIATITKNAKTTSQRPKLPVSYHLNQEYCIFFSIQLHAY